MCQTSYIYGINTACMYTVQQTNASPIKTHLYTTATSLYWCKFTLDYKILNDYLLMCT